MTKAPKDHSAWEALKAEKTREYEIFRSSPDYAHEESLLIHGISALHPQFIEQCSDVIALSVKQISAGKAVRDLDRATKTNIGPAIERKFLERFGLPQLEATEKIDTRINGVLIDIKTTIGTNWMIHQSCMGKWCLLFSENCEKMTFDLGIVFIMPDMLTKPNGDDKSSISAEGKKQINWIVRDEPMKELPADWASRVLVLETQVSMLTGMLTSVFKNLSQESLKAV